MKIWIIAKFAGVMILTSVLLRAASIEISTDEMGNKGVLAGSDGKALLVNASQGLHSVSPKSSARFVGSIRTEYRSFYWQADQVIRRRKGPMSDVEAEKPVEVRAYLRHGVSLNTEGVIDDGFVRRCWPEAGRTPAAVVFLWVVDDRVARVEVQAMPVAEDYLNFVLEGRASFSPEEAARCRVGVGIVREGKFLPPAMAFSEPSVEPVLEALLFDDVVLLRRVIESGLALRTATIDGMPLIRLAVQMGSAGVVKELLSREASLKNDKRADGEQLIHLATYCSRVAVTDVLLKAGSDPNSRKKNNFSPLMVAAVYGHLQIAQMLHRAGASLDDEFSSIPTNFLDAAISNNQQPMAEWLLQAGAKRPSDFRATSHIVNAAQDGDTRMLDWLLNQSSENAKNVSLSIALLSSAENGRNTEVVRLLVSAGASLKAKNARMETPLLIASRLGRADWVQAFLQVGADNRAVDEKGRTALHLASACNDGKSVQALLVANHSSLDVKDRDGKKPLAIALSGCSPKAVAALAEAGARIDLHSRTRTAQLIAAIQMDEGLLLKRAQEDGWKLEEKLTSNWSAVQLAEIYGSRQTIHSLGLTEPGSSTVLAEVVSLDLPLKPTKTVPVPDPRENSSETESLVLQCRVVVDPRGAVQLVDFVHRPEGSNLSKVMAAVEKWRFSAPTVAGKPTSVKFGLPLVIKAGNPQPALLSLVEEYPRLLRRVDPIWPPVVGENKGRVRCVLSLVVNTAGQVETVAVAEGLSEAYTNAVIAAVRQWQFQPARSKSRARAVNLVIPFEWTP